jgi:hypothetical protein
VIARATDFGLLIHESVKGIYKLITQVLLMEVGERLGLEAADLVKSNVETFLDEAEEQATSILDRIEKHQVGYEGVSGRYASYILGYYNLYVLQL